MKPNRDRFLVLLRNFARVPIKSDAAAELKRQEQRMPDFVSDVWRAEIVYQTDDVGGDTLFKDL